MSNPYEAPRENCRPAPDPARVPTSRWMEWAFAFAVVACVVLIVATLVPAGIYKK